MVLRKVITLPQYSVNDESATIIEWHKKDGEFVNVDELICSAETTKALFEIESENEGYIWTIISVGEEIETGEPIAILSDHKNDSKESIIKWLKSSNENDEKDVKKSSKPDKPATKKAMILASRLGINIKNLPKGETKLTASDVQNYYDKSRPTRPEFDFNLEIAHEEKKTSEHIEKILIIGGGYGAVQICDAIERSKTQRVYGVQDDSPQVQGKTILGFPVIGPIDLKHADDLVKSGEINSAIISLNSNIKLRNEIFNEWSSKGIEFASIVHPMAYLGIGSKMGVGNVILAFCQIGAFTEIGDNNFLSAYCNIEHHSHMGNGCCFGPVVNFSSMVDIGNQVRFGTGIFVEPFVKIGSNSVISSGSILTGNVADNTVVKVKDNLRKTKIK